jgi:phosphatidate cytidylyltransferase
MASAPLLRPDASGPGRARTRSEMTLRVASAAVLAPLALITAYIGGWSFAAFWGLAAIGVFWEWTTLVAQSSRAVFFAGGVGLAAATGLAALGRPLPAALVILGGAVLAGLLAPAERRIWAGAGMIYAGALLPAVGLRTDGTLGFVAIVFLFAIVWVTDILAYFIGRALGGPKLWPRMSPKKTWSGAIGGGLAAMIAGVLTAKAAGLDAVPALAVLAVILSTVSQLGDLFESGVKRLFGTKDAGHLIPGHGGLMDRLDGFLAAALAAGVIGLARGGADAAARGLLIW